MGERLQHAVCIINDLNILVYVIEILIRILGIGPFEYFRKQWNR